MTLCPRCNKRRKAVDVTIKKNGKHWIITRCGICKYNFDIEEWKSYEDDTPKEPPKGKRPPREFDDQFPA